MSLNAGVKPQACFSEKCLGEHHLVDFKGGKGELIGFSMSLKGNPNEKCSGQGSLTDE